MKETYWVINFSPMSSKVGRNMESQETPGSGGWTKTSSLLLHQREPPPPGLLTAAGKGVTSGKLVREMAGDAEGVGPLEFLVFLPSLFYP